MIIHEVKADHRHNGVVTGKIRDGESLSFLNSSLLDSISSLFPSIPSVSSALKSRESHAPLLRVGQDYQRVWQLSLLLYLFSSRFVLQMREPIQSFSCQ